MLTQSASCIRMHKVELLTVFARKTGSIFIKGTSCSGSEPMVSFNDQSIEKGQLCLLWMGKYSLSDFQILLYKLYF